MLTQRDLQLELWGSFLAFTKHFFPIITGRPFTISQPIGRESHFITIARELTNCARLQQNSLILNVPPGSGKPLCKSTLILTESGERKKLGDIKVGDRVLTHTGSFKPVTQLFPQGNLSTLKITTFSGREIISALDHTFLTAKGWKQANELIVGDLLGCVQSANDFGQSLSDYCARLLGYFIGDGNCAYGSASITACDELIIEDILKCISELGFKSTFVLTKLKNRPSHYSQTLGRINIKGGVREWLIAHGLTGKTSYTKRVPESIMRGNKQAIVNFLGAYFACDGTFGKKSLGRRDFSGSITSVSKELIKDCQHLFLRLGIRSRIRVKTRNQKTLKQGDVYTSYNLEFSSQDDMYHFQKLVGSFIYHKKAKQLMDHNFLRTRFDEKILPDPISCIEPNGVVDCMCIEVESNHTFTANDVIVHNSTLLSYWVAWTLSRYPDSQYLYISYGHDLAAKHTEMIKRIVSCAHYRDIFDVHIRHDSKAKDHFRTTAGGSIKAFGSAGGIVGHDAGLPNLERFSGAVILDDVHKIDEAHSETIRRKVIENYRETILQRPRSPNVPIICIGQRVHEDDIVAYMLSGNDERKWKTVILKALDDAGNALYPEVNPLAQLREKQEKNPYVFASQYQQNPIPSGGALFKPEWFVLLDEEPDILMTFITADTAETDKSYNDATVFSFWGLYVVTNFNNGTVLYGLHWIDCVELRIEPRDLEPEFISFYNDCMLHAVKPRFAAIEQKSTGVTLISTLKEMRGLQIREVKRTKASGSKTQRYLEMQPFVASKLISFTRNARHVNKCIEHMSKITANQSHRNDDIADTLYDSCKIALIDKAIAHQVEQTDYNALAKNLVSLHNKQNRSKRKAYSK